MVTNLKTLFKYFLIFALICMTSCSSIAQTNKTLPSFGGPLERIAGSLLNFLCMNCTSCGGRPRSLPVDLSEQDRIEIQEKYDALQQQESHPLKTLPAH